MSKSTDYVSIKREDWHALLNLVRVVKSMEGIESLSPLREVIEELKRLGY